MIVTPTPAPWIVIPFLTRNVRVQVAVPPGMVTVSPSAAEAIAAATSDNAVLFALTVVGPARRGRARIRVVASETRALTHGPGVERRTLRSPLGPFGIRQFPGISRPPHPLGATTTAN